MLDVHIREAQEDDLEAVMSLYAQPALDDGQVLPHEQAVDLFNRIKRYPDYKLYVAQSGITVIGTFALLIMDNLGHSGAPSGIIEDVAVHPKWQRKGVGRQMMQFAVGICRDRSCYKVSLSSNLKREEAHIFYEAVGFKRHGYSFLVDLDC